MMPLDTSPTRLVLASASPRRRHLLAAAGVDVAVHPADVDESPLPGETPAEHVERLARRKAGVVSERFPGELVLGADTIVLSPCGQILGKPTDTEDARRMLRLLSGHRHEVLTGVCLARVEPLHVESWVSSTAVTFKTLDEAAIRRYLSQVDTLDKAGGYAIQEHGDLLVLRTEGLLSTVIGLPVEDVLARLRRIPPACQ